ncbi:hypothetical protein LO80_04830 [Candidatus Francisella endociliophora]|uniref:Uncharacterized protein n=1 Tax=Candidatus Francisella endociliophora TaxID=653937 RepID=A0A097EP68_9GAMM|nr:hypothetical protein [Francisella sp. FSC1006]AIT09358.1 hypothetical protein LO80_04830 [Francisella sp. FSC1006]
MSERNIELVSWQEAQSVISKVNPDLAKVIDEIAPNESCKFFKTTYHFGDDIVKNGELHIPFKGELHPISATSLPASIVNELSYSNIPVGLPVDKNIEIYFEDSRGVVPYDNCVPGSLFSMRSLFSHDYNHQEFTQTWNISAGARSLYLLPKISDTRSFNRLKRAFSPNIAKAKDMFGQWDIFKLISENSDDKGKWTVDVYFFTKDWFDEAKNANLSILKLYFYDYMWPFFSRIGNSISFKYNFSNILIDESMSVNSYILDTLYHLYSIRHNIFPGFGIANNLSAPIDTFERALIDIYQISDIPIFMAPKYLNEDDNNSVYYSLKIPCLMDLSSRRKVSRKTDMLDLLDLINKFSSRVNSISGSGSCEKTLKDFVINTQYDFIHGDGDDGDDKFKPISNVYKEDKYLANYMQKYPSLKISERASFLRGSIKISTK